QNNHAGETDRSDQDIAKLGETGRVLLGRDDLDDDRRRRRLLHQNFSNASAASVRTATPLGPFGRYGRASSDHAVPAMSRCAHGTPSTNSLRNSAAVIEPAARPPVFIKSAMSLLI